MANKKISQLLENYEIGETIGKGRFAEVFRATKRDLGQEVALKILLPLWYENQTVREQFMEQAKIVARLKHPHIVEALDLGDENGRLFMATEYLPKGDLHHWLESLNKKRPLLLQVVVLVEDIAAALDFIHNRHSQGVPLVHGDVKPGNILLMDDRETLGRLRAKLSDLGMLTALQKGVTLSGSSMYVQSSPLYISPEQAGDQPPTPFSDQYSLGILTYEMLTGRVPFVGETDVTIYQKHKKESPQPPSALNPDLRDEIDAVLLKVLAKDPAQRFPSCVAFARALRQSVEIAEQKRFVSLLDEARIALADGKPEDALPALETARQIKPDDAEVKALLEQAQKTALAARNYQEAGDLLDAARAESKKLRAENLNNPDSQGLLIRFAPRPPAWWQVLFHQWKRALILAAGLILIAATSSGWYATNITTRDPAFQTRVAPFWTASPTFTPTYTPTATLTPSPTPTFTPTITFTPTTTPTPPLVDITHASHVKLLHRMGGLENAGWVNSVAFSQQGDLLAAGSDDGKVRIWRVSDWKVLHVIDNGYQVTTVAFSPDGQILAVGLSSGFIRLWNIQSGKAIGDPLSTPSGVVTVAFSPNGEVLASGLSDTIFLWDVASRELINNPLQHSGMVNSMAFSPNGEMLASGLSINFVILWNIKERTVLETIVSSGPVRSIAFSPNSQTLAFGSQDGFIRLWDIESGQSRGDIRTFSPIPSLKFSPDGTILASGLDDHTIRLWDISSQQQFGEPLQGHSNFVWSIAFSPDGWWLVSSSENEVFLWGVPRWNQDTPTPSAIPTGTINPTFMP